MKRLTLVLPSTSVTCDKWGKSLGIMQLFLSHYLCDRVCDKLYFCDKFQEGGAFIEIAQDVRSRSWFCVLNNPADHGYSDEPQECVDGIVSAWTEENPTRSCAVTFCISADGLRHCHAVFEDTKLMRFSAVKKVFPSMHIEPTKGNKEQAEDYINKRGIWAEKGEQILAIARCGEIKGRQGQRRDFEVIDDLLAQGKTPSEIFDVDFSFRRYEKMIKQAYFDKRVREAPLKRNLVCCLPDGTPITSGILQHHFHEVLCSCGLPSIRFHDLRHTNATLMLRHNVPAKIVSSMLGHSSIGITMDTYSHVMTDMQAGAVGVMDTLLK